VNIPAITQRFNMAIGEYGQDYAVPVGTPIYSPVAGIVGTEDKGKQAWGKRVIVNAQAGYSFAVGHLTQFVVTAGQKVKAGQLIGYSGGALSDPSSGVSTGPHVETQFFQMTRKGVTYIDPRTVFGQFASWEAAIFNGGGSSVSPSSSADSSSSSSSWNPLDNVAGAIGQASGDAIKAATRAAWYAVGVAIFMFGILVIFAGDIERAVDHASDVAEKVAGPVAEVAA
jgi:murein DD-endopeptidase MepM/ murein hydrolase activator NlpD